jgi:hypothetical protein
MEEEDSIRTLTLRFATKETARRFYELCDRHGHQPAIKTDGVWHVVTAVFQNKTARSKLVAMWAKESMVVTE